MPFLLDLLGKFFSGTGKGFVAHYGIIEYTDKGYDDKKRLSLLICYWVIDSEHMINFSMSLIKEYKAMEGADMLSILSQ